MLLAAAVELELEAVLCVRSCCFMLSLRVNALARLIAPRRPIAAKLTTYECGIDPVGEGWSQTQVRYFLYAFLFVIFDVESVFLFPWAVVFQRLGYTAVVEMAIFIGILALGLLYAYRKGVLHWEGMTTVKPAPRVATPRGFTRVPPLRERTPS